MNKPWAVWCRGTSEGIPGGVRNNSGLEGGTSGSREPAKGRDFWKLASVPANPLPGSPWEWMKREKSGQGVGSAEDGRWSARWRGGYDVGAPLTSAWMHTVLYYLLSSLGYYGRWSITI